jgi:hypothetical protein
VSKNSKRKLEEVVLVNAHAFARVQGNFFSEHAGFELAADLEHGVVRIYKKGYGSVHVPFANVKCFKTKMGAVSGDVLEPVKE